MKEKLDLRAVELFRWLLPEELSVLEGRMERHRFAKGEVIFTQGSPGSDLYIIESGRVEVSLNRGGVVVVLAELGENSFFGELAWLTEQSRSATARALTPVVAYSISRSTLVDLYDRSPGVACKLLRALAESLSDRVLTTNAQLELYFLINQAIVDSEQFRNLYISVHKRAPSSSGQDITLSR